VLIRATCPERCPEPVEGPPRTAPWPPDPPSPPFGGLRTSLAVQRRLPEATGHLEFRISKTVVRSLPSTSRGAVSRTIRNPKSHPPRLTGSPRAREDRKQLPRFLEQPPAFASIADPCRVEELQPVLRLRSFLLDDPNFVDEVVSRHSPVGLPVVGANRRASLQQLIAQDIRDLILGLRSHKADSSQRKLLCAPLQLNLVHYSIPNPKSAVVLRQHRYKLDDSQRERLGPLLQLFLIHEYSPLWSNPKSAIRHPTSAIRKNPFRICNFESRIGNFELAVRSCLACTAPSTFNVPMTSTSQSRRGSASEPATPVCAARCTMPSWPVTTWFTSATSRMSPWMKLKLQFSQRSSCQTALAIRPCPLQS